MGRHVSTEAPVDFRRLDIARREPAPPKRWGSTVPLEWIEPEPPARRWGDAQYTIRRLPIGDPSAWPWKIRKAGWPSWIGIARTHAGALARVGDYVTEDALAQLGWTEVGHLAELDREAAGERHEERKREDRHS